MILGYLTKSDSLICTESLQVSQVRPIFEYVGDSAPRGCIEDEGMAPRSWLTDAGFKAPQAAGVKSHGGER